MSAMSERAATIDELIVDMPPADLKALAKRLAGQAGCILVEAPLTEARGYELLARLERYEDCLRTVCHHLLLPQSASGPCDDPSRYGRDLEGLIAQLEEVEAELKLTKERRFRAEGALHPFAEAAKGLSDVWAGTRRAATISWDGLTVDHFRKAGQALAVNQGSGK